MPVGQLKPLAPLLGGPKVVGWMFLKEDNQEDNDKISYDFWPNVDSIMAVFVIRIH